MTERVFAFSGSVHCERAAGALGLTLSGAGCGAPAEQAVLAFSAPAPREFPGEITDALIERLSPGRYRIASGSREWLIEAAAVHVHRAVAAPFYAAIPPRPVPPARRLLWKVALALAASRTGLAVLRALRR
jgi:hypothetical protein